MSDNPGNQTGDNGDGGSVSNGFVLPEALKESEHLRSFKTYDELAQAHHDLKSNQPVIPEAYDYTAPEDHELDEVAHGLFLDLSKEIGLTQPQYEALMDFDYQRYSNEFNQIVQNREEAKEELQKEYGDEYDAKLDGAKKAVHALMGEEAGKEMLQDPDFGDNPKFIRLMITIASKISEDSLQTGGGEGDGDVRPKGIDGKARLRYPSMGD